jgi:hypothetical protein
MKTEQLYVISHDGRTNAFWMCDLVRIIVPIGEDADPYSQTIVLDTDEKIAEYLPGGRWEEVVFPDEVLGKHDTRVKSAVRRPREADRSAFNAMSAQEQYEYLESNAELRWPAILASSLIEGWSFTKASTLPDDDSAAHPMPVSEGSFYNLPLAVCRALTDMCSALWGSPPLQSLLRVPQPAVV